MIPKGVADLGYGAFNVVRGNDGVEQGWWAQHWPKRLNPLPCPLRVESRRSRCCHGEMDLFARGELG